MAGSAQLLAKFLTGEQKREILHHLVSTLAEEENTLSLVELLDVLEEADVLYTSEAVSSFVIDSISNNNVIHENLIKLLSKLDGSFAKVLDWLSSAIISIVFERLNYLIPDSLVSVFSEEFESTDIDKSEVSLSYLASVLSKLLSVENVEIPNNVDKLILLLISINDEAVSDTATKSLRWRDLSQAHIQCLIKQTIPSLIESDNKYQKTNGFILWLRFLLNLQKSSVQSTEFDLMIRDDKYWNSIQHGLISSIHEHRKYSLSILKLSIQINHIDVNNNYIELKSSNSESQISAWKRFSTFFEIVGIDTAINQAEAARNDIVQLLSTESAIKPSWGLALLCTGFKGSMESVRKLSLELMYSIPKDSLNIFAHEFLTSVFLKYATEAHHFKVKEIRGKITCKYGEKLEKFIENVLRSLRSKPYELERTATSLLNFLVGLTTSFAPARIYISSGILKGLKGRQVFTREHSLTFIKLFESTAEDDLFETYLQSIHLLLLNHIRSDVQSVLSLLTRFVQINGYSVFKHNQEVFLDYVSIHHDKDQEQEIFQHSNEVEYQIILYSLFQLQKTSDNFLKELALSGLDISSNLNTQFSELLKSLLQLNSQEFEKADSLISLSIFRNSWSSVDLKILYDSIVTSETFDLAKFKLFTKAYKKVTENSDKGGFIDFAGLIKLDDKLSGIAVNFKVRDVITSEYHSLISSFLKVSAITDDQVDQLLRLTNSHLSSGFFHGYSGICSTLKYLLSNYSVDITTTIEILEALWKQVTSERLVLSQKDMHISFIETLYHETILKDSINNEFNAKILLSIGLDIVSQSFIRRSLLPALSKKILQYSIGYKQEFDQTEWLIQLLLKAFTLIQDDTHLFKIKTLIGWKFDNEISFEGSLYEKIYGPEEISSKINIISILSLASESFTKLYFEELLSNDKYSLVKPMKRTDGTEELQRIYAFSSLLLVSRTVSTDTLSSIVSSILLPSLENEPSPLVRVYLEWIIAIDLIQSKKNRNDLFRYFQDQNKPTLISSVERIAVLSAAHVNSEDSSEYFNQFIKYLIPNCSSNKPLIRHFSNSLILTLYPLMKEREVKLEIDGVLEVLHKEAKKSEITGKFRSGDALFWNAYEDFNLTGIFGGVLSKLSPRPVIFITERAFQKYTITKLNTPIGSNDGISQEFSEDDSKKQDNLTSNSPLQTKSGAWESVLDIDEKSRAVKRSDLIVVSSLVDKPPNLGGICRLCDVLGAGLMTVDDLRVKNHTQFKNVAVTADYWMPIQEVKIGDIADFMNQKKKEGYTLIGLEQTDKSITLGKDTPFPKKSLILLGTEAEGIPGPLLAELDYCVEIRQQGVIRSMNIQTATAVIVHAYASSQSN